MKLKDNHTRELLGYFLGFANEKLDELNFDNLLTVAMTYVRFTLHNDGTSEFRNYKVKYDLLSEPVFEKSEAKLETIKIFLKEIQVHLCNILDMLIAGKTTTPIKQTGTRTITIIDDKFVEQFETTNIPVNTLDVELEKGLAESVLADILIKGGLTPSHFKRCKHCNNYFYQLTKRNKEYCSNNCSSIVRQRAFQKAKKKK